jgi:ABC-type transporter MlaC component
VLDEPVRKRLGSSHVSATGPRTTARAAIESVFSSLKTQRIGKKTPWNQEINHDGMLAIAESLIAQAQMLVGEAGFEVKLLEEQEKAAAALKKAMDDNTQKLLDQAAKDQEKKKEDA